MSASSVYLPEELIEEILSVSPAKSVLRFKSVSKQWHAIISDSRFSRIHRIRRSKLSENQNMFFVCRSRKMPPEVGSISLMRLDDGKLRKVSELDHQPALTDNHRYYTPLSSCNGVFLLTIDHSDYMLWNPSIRKSTMFSAPCTDRCPSNLLMYHFYHDETSDDYKIVIVHRIFGVHNYDHRYMVYSCNNHSWGETLEMNMPCDMNHCFTFVDGCFYVLCNDEEIVYFLDFRDGKLDKIPHPNIYDYYYDDVEEEEEEGLLQKVRLKAISGRLCLCLYTFETSASGEHRRHQQLWVMERNEKLEHCWRKLISRDMDKEEDSYTRLFRSMWLSNEDNVFIGRFDMESNLSLCVEKEFHEDMEFDCNGYFPDFFQYQENLYMLATY